MGTPRCENRAVTDVIPNNSAAEATHDHVRTGFDAEDLRQAITLREIEGLSYTEIAESASIELGTVKSRISRGRSLLRNFLSGNGNFFEIASSKVTECNREEMSAK